MRLEEEIECRVRLTLSGIAEADFAGLVRAARSFGRQVSVAYLPNERYRVSVDFKDAPGDAQALIDEARKIQRRYDDRE